MTRSILRRTATGAVLALLLGGLAAAPAHATGALTITWQGEIADGQSFVYGEVPAAPTCTAVDELAVAATCTVTGYDTTVGTHILTATAVGDDLATASEIRTYTVSAWELKGFYAPVKKTPGTWNKAKGGSTVPLKFKVYQGADKAKDAGVVAAFTALPVLCTELTADATPVGVPVPVASSGKGFRLKYTHGRFHQNWKTPKVAKAKTTTKGKPVATPTCYQVTMTTQDGSALNAYFRLK